MPTPNSALKQQRRDLREQFRSKRRALSGEVQAAHGKALLELFKANPLAHSSKPVGLFVSQDGEPHTDSLIRHCHALQQPVALPCIGENRNLYFRRYAQGSELVTGRLGLQEPSPNSDPIAVDELAVLLMPLVAFDDHGNRLGMGGGYYDRLLGSVANESRPLLVGVAHAVQRSATPLPSADWDVPLDAAMTETGWLTFSARAERALGYTAHPTRSR